MAKRRSVAHLRKYQFGRRKASRRSSAGKMGGFMTVAKTAAIGVGAYVVAGMVPGVFGLSGELKRLIYLGLAALIGVARSFALKGMIVAGAILGLGFVSGLMGNGSGAAASWGAATSQGGYSW